MKKHFSRVLILSRVVIVSLLASNVLLTACGQSGNLVQPKKTFDSPS